MEEDLTLLDAVVRRVRECGSAPDGVAAPAAILWTDPERHWLPLMDALGTRVPELFRLGDYDPERRTGPAIWLRCVVDGSFEQPGVPASRVPVLYLAGVGRQQLRAGEDCPDSLRPLVELMYRGTLWLQKGGHDWTLSAFLSSPQGLGLDLARDQVTREALSRALREVAEAPLTQLRSRRLEADDFDRLLSTDLFRDLLRWMGDPRGWRERAGDERWAAFRNQCGARLGFDPEADGELEAGRRLAGGEGEWADAWSRFAEAPQAYPGIPELLRRSRPPELFVDRARWPDENERAEANTRDALADLPGLPHAEACRRVLDLEAEHGERRGWVWARLGLAPLADALQPLAALATHASTLVGGSTPDDIAHSYATGGWRADRAALEALARARPNDEGVIGVVVAELLRPWLDGGARLFQKAVEDHPLPGARDAEVVAVAEGGCLVFVDGLRYDLGRALAERLEGRGCRVDVGTRWAALPTVTATAKPAVTPVANEVAGAEMPEDFTPVFAAQKRPAVAARIRTELEAAGYQVLGGDLGDWPASDRARGWSEAGSIDALGHKLSAGLAGQVEKELDRLTDRVVALLDAGWSLVRVVTDHGWLLLPGGLPKIDLPKHLTASRWSRCAAIAGASEVSVPTAPWHWNASERFATAPGIACFNASPAYAHGGLSVQECLVPDLVVERARAGAARATIDSLTWRGMRCVVRATATGSGVRADLRFERPLGPSVAASVKPLDPEGRVSLVVAQDRFETAQLVLVLLAEDDTVLAQLETRVGESP